jgi:hypothetical protein
MNNRFPGWPGRSSLPSVVVDPSRTKEGRLLNQSLGWVQTMGR